MLQEVCNGHTTRCILDLSPNVFLFLELFLSSFDKKGKGFLISKVYFVRVRNIGGKQKENDLVKTASTFPKPSLMCAGIHSNGFGL